MLKSALQNRQNTSVNLSKFAQEKNLQTVWNFLVSEIFAHGMILQILGIPSKHLHIQGSGQKDNWRRSDVFAVNFKLYFTSFSIADFEQEYVCWNSL